MHVCVHTYVICPQSLSLSDKVFVCMDFAVTWQYLTKKQTGMMALLSAFADKYFTIRAVLEKRAIRPHACPISLENE